MIKNKILTTLKNNNFKITQQRQAIIETLISNCSILLSAEDLFKYTKVLYPKTNMTTIYRNLEIFVNLNLVHKIITDKGTSLFQLVCVNNNHHHIIMCKECGRTEMIDYCPLNDLEKISNEKNFNLISHKLELYGICKQCLSKK
ncbi:MAG: Fur family transcriptional regulator [Eubacteriaceae bacterium]